MAIEQTANAGLLTLDRGTLDWDTQLNGNAEQLDGLSAIGGLAVRSNEYPSSSLSVAVAPGTWASAEGTLTTYAGATVTLAASATNYLYLDATGALQRNTTGFPTTAIIQLATVVTGASTVTTITDSRIAYQQTSTAGLGYITTAGGYLSEGANIATGTATGSKLAITASEKLGFWGTTPIVQPTLTYSRSGSGETAAVAAIRAALASAGLVLDSTTA